jgi:glycosyltransferase involved in cell wall biosynthesis
MVQISVAIITYNEEKNIERCLKSVQTISQDIVVVDSYSTDKTEEICQKYGVRFIKNKFEGHVEQKNFASNQCVNSWVLSLDADEALSEELQKSILTVIQNPDSDSYSFNRATHYCGKHIRHGGWYPDPSLRLWNREKGKWAGNNPHDRYYLNEGATRKHIAGDLLHYSFNSIEEHITQINKFSTISAMSKFKKGKKSNLFQITIAPRWRFIHNYFIKRGFLDGYYGYVIAVNSAQEVFLKYSKLRDLWKNAQIKNK